MTDLILPLNKCTKHPIPYGDGIGVHVPRQGSKTGNIDVAAICGYCGEKILFQNGDWFLND